MKSDIFLHPNTANCKNKDDYEDTLFTFSDLVGCFDVPHRRSPLQKSPENPALLNTRFYLFTRKTNFSDPEIIYYNDGGKSLNESRFNYSLPLKLIIHGYMGQWSDSGYVIGADAYLKIVSQH